MDYMPTNNKGLAAPSRKHKKILHLSSALCAKLGV
jgi:hypothetical protein